jgi:hypothetical protein
MNWNDCGRKSHDLFKCKAKKGGLPEKSSDVETSRKRKSGVEWTRTDIGSFKCMVAASAGDLIL